MVDAAAGACGGYALVRMADSAAQYADRVDALRGAIVGQGHRVLAMLESAFGSVFDHDESGAKAAIDLDDEIDRVDVEIEQDAVALLAEAMQDEGDGLDRKQLREVLTVVKVNNELERAGDAGVRAAEHVGDLIRGKAATPDTFRVMTNSVLGILRDVITAYESRDGDLAIIVLKSESAVTSFKAAILKDVENSCAAGAIDVEAAQIMHELATDADRIADYCSNIAEQVLYAATGKIVRHTEAGWIEVQFRENNG